MQVYDPGINKLICKHRDVHMLCVGWAGFRCELYSFTRQIAVYDIIIMTRVGMHLRVEEFFRRDTDYYYEEDAHMLLYMPPTCRHIHTPNPNIQMMIPKLNFSINKPQVVNQGHWPSEEHTNYDLDFEMQFL